MASLSRTFGAEKIYPAIADDYAAMVVMSPTRRATEIQAKAEKKAKKKDKNDKRGKKDDTEEPDEPDETDEPAVASAAAAHSHEWLDEVMTAVRDKKENAMFT